MENCIEKLMQHIVRYIKIVEFTREEILKMVQDGYIYEFNGSFMNVVSYHLYHLYSYHEIE